MKVVDNDCEIDHEVRLHEQENSLDRWHDVVCVSGVSTGFL